MAETEKRAVSDRLDEWGRRHVWVALFIAFLLAILATPLMIGATEAAVVLYRDF